MALPANDTFTGTTGTNLSAYSANWTDSSNPMEIQSNKACGTVGSNSANMSWWDADSFASAHYSKGTYAGATSSNDGPGPAVRCQPSALSFYYTFCDTTTCYTGQVIAGSPTDWDSGHTVAINDVIELRIDVTVTSTVYFYRNSSLVATYLLKTALSNGAAGVGMFNAGSNPGVDNWEGGDVGGGGTLYTSTIAGAFTPHGAVVKRINKRLSGVVTPVGTLRKVVSKVTIGTVTPVGTLKKIASKVLSGSVSVVGSLSISLRYAITLTGVVTPVGVVVQRVNKIFTGSVTPVGTLTKQINKSFNAVTTPVGVLVKRVSKVLSGGVNLTGSLNVTLRYAIILAGAVTPIGTLVKQVSKVFTGNATPVGLLVKQVNKSFNGVVTPVGVLIKQVNMLFVGVINGVGDLTSNIISGGGQLYEVVLEGVLTVSGSIVKSVSKVLNGVVTPSGVVSKVISKNLTGSVSATGVLVKKVSVTLSGGVALTGTLVKRVSKTFTGVVTPTGTLVKSYIRYVVLSGVVTPVGSLVSQFISGSGVVVKSMLPWIRRRRRGE